MSQIENNNLSQAEIDETEWKNPENWHWSFYYSAKDSRTFVPRRWYGQTVNFASVGTYWFLLAILFPAVAVIAGVLLSGR